MSALMDSMPVTRSSATLLRAHATGNPPASRANFRTPRFSLGTPPSPKKVSSRLAACLDRCDAAGIRLVVTAPSNLRMFSRGLGRFPDRRTDRSEHVQWDTAYRIFCGRGSQTFDRGSWRILAVERDDRVVGAITARFFCGEIVRDYLHVLSLLESTGPVFREHCELAVSEAIATSLQTGRTPAEISHWAVAPVWHAALISVTLLRAMGALAAAFDAPLAILAADNRRGEVTRLMRFGGVPLGLAGRSCLPPFVHHESGAWLRLLLLDATAFHARSGRTPTADLSLLRQRARIISAA